MCNSISFYFFSFFNLVSNILFSLCEMGVKSCNFLCLVQFLNQSFLRNEHKIHFINLCDSFLCSHHFSFCSMPNLKLFNLKFVIFRKSYESFLFPIIFHVSFLKICAIKFSNLYVQKINLTDSILNQ